MKASDIRNIILIFSLFGLLAQFSCKKEEDDLLVPRIFRPVANVDNTMDNVLIVYFKSIEGAEVYEADISLDSTFLTIEQSITIDPDTAEIIYESTKYSYIIFSELLAAQEYFIRVKAIHADSTMSSGYYVFYAQTLNIFVNPTVSEILDVAFKCKWDVKGELLTKIVVRLTENDSLISENWVLDVENKTGVRVIDGLEGNTTYSVYLYSGNLFSGTTLRGKGTITTQPAIEGNIVDLRFMESNTALWDTIHKVESGVTILLKRGQTYIFPSKRLISGSVTVMSGYDFATELAEIQLDGNAFSTPLNSYIDEIVFRDVNVNSIFGDASYFFFLEEFANIKKIKFDNVRSHGHRGFVRIGPDVVIDSLIINNCVIDSVREYGITHITGANANIKNIGIKNSTFYYLIRPHYNRSAAVTSSNTITHENVTFFNTPDAGRYFFDYETGTEVTFKNCIFGQVKSLLSPGDTTKGYKPNTVTITSQGSYYTNDFISAAEPLPGLIPYTKSSFDLFEDPDNHNFKIKDAGFPGKETAGDPRWW